MRRQTPSSIAELQDYVAGGLDTKRRRAVETRAEVDETLARWLEERSVEQQAFLFDPRRRPFSDLVREAGVERKQKRIWGLAAGGSMVMAVVMLLALSFDETPYGEIRTKGGISVQAAVLDDGQARLHVPGRALRPGDRVRLNVTDPRGGYMTVLLEEESGQIDALYRPEELGKLTAGSHRLPGSLELDERLGRERLYIIVSDTPPEIDDWLEEVRTSRGKRGFEHGWLPAGQARVGILEYEKVEGP